MRRLTFCGFLKDYVKKLSLSNSNDFYKLAAEVRQNFRLFEPLFLYALSTGKIELLLKATKDQELHEQFVQLANMINFNVHDVDWEEQTRNLGERYSKVYRSYVSVRDMPETKNNTKLLMHNRIVQLQAEKKISNYRLYSDLKLNPSNVNAFIKNADTKKLSLANARKILEYLKNA